MSVRRSRSFELSFVVVAVLVVAACGSDNDAGSTLSTPPTECHVEIGGRTRLDAETELHRGPAFHDEQMAAVVVADVVEHRADEADPDEVHDALRKLADVGGSARIQ